MLFNPQGSFSMFGQKNTLTAPMMAPSASPIVNTGQYGEREGHKMGKTCPTVQLYTTNTTMTKEKLDNVMTAL